MAFKAMKDYIADTRGLVTERDFLRLSMRTTENTEAISEMMSEDVKMQIHELIDKMKKNPPLVLK